MIEQLEIAFTQGSKTTEAVEDGLRILYGTRAGSLALDREFGLSWDALSLPMPAAQAAMSAEIIAKTKRYEPRVRVTAVEWFEEAADGVLIAKVRCESVTNEQA